MLAIERIKKFEQPIYEDIKLETNRILSSQVFFNINLSEEEFWNLFLEYIFKNVVNLENKLNLKVNNLFQIKTDDGSIKPYVLTEYVENEIIELSCLLNEQLTKIYVKTKKTKHDQTIKVEYIESQRKNIGFNKKEHKKQQKSFNSKVLNKVIILKNFLLEKVRSKS
ncbi:hypothetical protein CG006_01590 [Mesoplasma florum]|uniref:hypothetical protein n=1 Tax=Mesoplasma florum TaxID=2151 RepID=UPI000D037BA7|nr:hypothetical protein [Mesoplasma florum]AVN63671.1 hypothetical protein CG006_01590 [Mesoplasma florum]